MNVITYQELFTAENALELIKDYDFIVDGTDNFPVKFLINDACVLGKKPFSHRVIVSTTNHWSTHVEEVLRD